MYVFMDNFYTRYSMAKDIAKFSDDEIHCIGTVKINMVDSCNIYHVTDSIAELQGSPRNLWKSTRTHVPILKESKRKKRKCHIQKRTMYNYCTPKK